MSIEMDVCTVIGAVCGCTRTYRLHHLLCTYPSLYSYIDEFYDNCTYWW